MPDRPPIPENVQRQVRQHCGFCCVLCGCPIYEIHHIEGFASTNAHDPENLVLLCPTHHAEATKDLVPADAIRNARERPIARQTGSSAKHKFHFSGDSCRVLFGDSDSASFGVVKHFSALIVDGHELLGFRFFNGVPLLNAVLLNEYNNCILTINDGWMQYTPKTWDITFRGRTLTLRDAPRNIRLKIEFHPPNEIRIHNALFLCNGVALKIAPKGICCLNDGATWAFDDLRTEEMPHQIAISLGRRPVDLQAAITLTEINRYKRVPFSKRISSPRPNSPRDTD